MTEIKFKPIIITIKMDQRSRPRKVKTEGYSEIVTNHDGTTDQYINTILSRTNLSDRKILLVGDITIEDGEHRYSVDKVFLHPSDANFLFRVSPLAA